MKRFVTVLDTEAGSSFIRLDELRHRLREKVKPLNRDFNARNTRAKPVPVTCSIKLVVNPETSTETVRL